MFAVAQVEREFETGTDQLHASSLPPLSWVRQELEQLTRARLHNTFSARDSERYVELCLVERRLLGLGSGDDSSCAEQVARFEMIAPTVDAMIGTA